MRVGDDAHRPTTLPDSVWSAALYAFVQAGLTTLAVLIVWAWLPLGETELEPVSLSVRLHRAFLVGPPVVGGVLLVVGAVLLRAGRSRWPLILGLASIVHAVRSSTTRYLSAPGVPPGRA